MVDSSSDHTDNLITGGEQAGADVPPLLPVRPPRIGSTFFWRWSL